MRPCAARAFQARCRGPGPLVFPGSAHPACLARVAMSPVQGRLQWPLSVLRHLRDASIFGENALQGILKARFRPYNRGRGTPMIRMIRFAVAITLALILGACGGGGDGEEPPANQPPSADAGADQTVDAGDTVMLDGSGSSDPDGTVAGYQWMQSAGPDGIALERRPGIGLLCRA